MKRLAAYLVVAVVPVVLATPLMAERVVTCHIHDAHTDGQYDIATTAAKAGAMGAELVILGDHAEGINDPAVKLDMYNILGTLPDVLYRAVRADKGISTAAWLGEIDAYNQSGREPKVAPGLEAGLGQGRKNHVLVISPDYRDLWYRVVQLAESPKAETAPVETLNALADLVHSPGRCGMLVAAHPTNQKYGFTLPLDRIDGVEFFNVADPRDGREGGGSPVKTLKWLADAPGADRRLMTMIAGADYHGEFLANPADTGDRRWNAQLQRHTIVRTNSNDPDEIIAAMCRGECYAAVGNARLPSAVPVGKLLEGNCDLGSNFTHLCRVARGGGSRVLVSLEEWNRAPNPTPYEERTGTNLYVCSSSLVFACCQNPTQDPADQGSPPEGVIPQGSGGRDEEALVAFLEEWANNPEALGFPPGSYPGPVQLPSGRWVMPEDLAAAGAPPELPSTPIWEPELEWVDEPSGADLPPAQPPPAPVPAQAQPGGVPPPPAGYLVFAGGKAWNGVAVTGIVYLAPDGGNGALYLLASGRVFPHQFVFNPDTRTFPEGIYWQPGPDEANLRILGLCLNHPEYGQVNMYNMSLRKEWGNGVGYPAPSLPSRFAVSLGDIIEAANVGDGHADFMQTWAAGLGFKLSPVQPGNPVFAAR